jgi:hypothetical protein
MKLYGYGSSRDAELQQMKEVSIVAGHDELLALAAFFAKCAFEIQQQSDWEHAHLCDFMGKTKSRKADVIVVAKR